MSKSHSDKHERLDLDSVGRRVVSAGAPAARNFLAVFLVFAIIFGLTFGFLFFTDIKVGDAQVSASVAGTDLPEANNSLSSNYSVADIAVSSDGTIEIGSLAGLLIASYAYNSNKSVADILGSKFEGAQNANTKSFRLVNNISGIFTPQDISVLDDAFPSGWGKSAEGNAALENVVKAKAGDTLTILNSLFGDFSGTFDGKGYVINAFNIMGGTDDAHMENAGFFATIDLGADVRNLHLRNVNIVADGVTNVGGLAGTALSDVTNVSVHGIFNVAYVATAVATSSNIAVGGIVGTLGKSGNAPTLSKAIALGTIYANGYRFVGGAVGYKYGNSVGGSFTQNIQEVVSMMYIWAHSDICFVDNIVAGGITNVKDCYYLNNSAWRNEKVTDSVADGSSPFDYSATHSAKPIPTKNEYLGSIGGYGDDHYYQASKKGNYDVLDDFILDDAGYEEGSAPAPRESMRLCDLIDVYLLKYSLQEDSVQVGDISYKVYKKSEKSWLVGNAKGIDSERGDPVEADPIIISNQQGVSLLRELRFATFKLTADVYLPASYMFETWQGAFYGKIYNNKTGDNAYDENGYHIYIKGYKEENIFELTPTDTILVKFPVKGY